MEEDKNNLYNVPEIRLVYQSQVPISSLPKITSSKDAVDILRQTWDHDTIELFEEFKMLVLNRANRVLGICKISQGGVSGTIADPKLIFVTALKAHSVSIVISHNHPSGNLTPSKADIELTKKLTQGGKILEIQVLDHIIITSEGYYSFADDGMI